MYVCVRALLDGWVCARTGSRCGALGLGMGIGMGIGGLGPPWRGWDLGLRYGYGCVAYGYGLNMGNGAWVGRGCDSGMGTFRCAWVR